LEIQRERGVLKTKIFKGKYEPKLEFPEGREGGLKPISPLWGEYGYFLEQHNHKELPNYTFPPCRIKDSTSSALNELLSHHSINLT